MRISNLLPIESSDTTSDTTIEIVNTNMKHASNTNKIFQVSKSPAIKSLSFALLTSVLTGCAGFYGAQQTNLDAIVDLNTSTARSLTGMVAGKNTVLPAYNEEIPPNAAHSGLKSEGTTSILVKRSPNIWVGRKSTALEKSANLPAEFSKKMSLYSKDEVQLPAIVQLLKEATGFKIVIQSDMQPGYLARSNVVDGSTNLTLITPPTTNDNSSKNKFVDSIKLNYNTTLSRILDDIAEKMGGSWEWRGDAVHFFRYYTRSFVLKNNPGDVSYAFKSGGSNSSSGTNGTSGSSGTGSSANDKSSSASSSTEGKTAEFSVWKDIDGQIKSMLSTSGKYYISQSTGSISITDFKSNVDRIGEMIERENATLTKQVAFRVEVMSVTTDNNKGYGVDWTAVYNKLADLKPGYKIDVLSPPSLISSGTAGGFGITVLGGSDNGLTGNRWANSKAMLDLLNQVGKASVVTSASTVTLNRKAVPVAVTKQISYLAQTTPAASTSGTTGTSSFPGLTPGVVTTGFNLSILPTVMANNKVMLQFWLDLSSLDQLKVITSGTGVNQQSIQTPEISSFQSAQNIALNLGETLVLSGFERSTHQYDKRTLHEDASLALGGSYAGKEKIESTVIMITPTLVGGL